MTGEALDEVIDALLTNHQAGLLAAPESRGSLRISSLSLLFLGVARGNLCHPDRLVTGLERAAL